MLASLRDVRPPMARPSCSCPSFIIVLARRLAKLEEFDLAAFLQDTAERSTCQDHRLRFGFDFLVPLLLHKEMSPTDIAGQLCSLEDNLKQSHERFQTASIEVSPTPGGAIPSLFGRDEGEEIGLRQVEDNVVE